MVGRNYPPVGHMIRHLRMSLEVRSETELVGSMPVSDDLRDPGGSLRMGALATFVDVAAGTFVQDIVRPDWLATMDMRVIARRGTEADSIDIHVEMVRAGKRSVMSVSTVSDDHGVFARGWVTYARLARREDSPEALPGSGIGRKTSHVEPDEATRTRPPFDEYLGVQIADADDDGTGSHGLVLTAEHRTQIHNSFGSLQGGAAAAFMERVGMLAGDRAWDGPNRVVDLHTYYLRQTRDGPFRIEGKVLANEDASLTVEAQVLDAGNDNALLATGTAIVQRLPD